jgi:hypothetical protein
MNADYGKQTMKMVVKTHPKEECIKYQKAEAARSRMATGSEQQRHSS